MPRLWVRCLPSAPEGNSFWCWTVSGWLQLSPPPFFRSDQLPVMFYVPSGVPLPLSLLGGANPGPYSPPPHSEQVGNGGGVVPVQGCGEWTNGSVLSKLK